MRKILTSLLCVIMVVVFMPTIAWAEDTDLTDNSPQIPAELSGAGTETDPYLINTLDDLTAFRNSVNGGKDYLGQYVLLNADIDLSSIADWTPIGAGVGSGKTYTEGSTPFKGTFDGGEHTISNLKITEDDKTANMGLGLFGIVDGGTIRNLKLANVNINAPNNEMAGSAIGMMVNGSTAENIEVLSGSSLTAKAYSGGIVGRMTVFGTISGCINRANVTAKGTGVEGRNLGGIVGAAFYTEEDTGVGKEMNISSCENYGTVTSSGTAVGGIVGLSAANVDGCLNEGNVTGNGDRIGGIIGEVQSYGNVTGNTNNGDVTNNSKDANAYGTGGIIGWVRYLIDQANYPTKRIVEIKNNTNTGIINGGNDGGGIVGTIYNAAVVTGNENTATSIRGKTFAAGIVGNLQRATGNKYYDEPNIQVTNNISTTPIDRITLTNSTNKDLYAYNNETANPANPFVVENNVNVGDSWVAQIGNDRYLSLQAAVAAANNGDLVKMVKNTTEDVEIPAGKAVTLDLAGKTITVISDCGISVKGSLTVIDSAEDGKITCQLTPIEVDGIKALFTLEKGKIVSTGDYGVYVKNGGSVTVNGGEIESLDAALSGNNTTGDMNFTVTNGTLTAKQGPAIYMPGQVNLKISGGTLNGGVSLRMGQVKISGGVFNAITKNIDSPKEFYKWPGNAWLPDALYVFNGTYTSKNEVYGNSLNLEITGGTFNCTNGQGSAVAIYDIGKEPQKSKIEISKNAVLITNAADRKAYQVLTLKDIGVDTPAEGYGKEENVGKVETAISGGTYSSKISEEYLAEGFQQRENSNGTFTVYKPSTGSYTPPADNVTNQSGSQGTGTTEPTAPTTTANMSSSTTVTTETKVDAATGETKNVVTSQTTVDNATAEKIVEKALANKSEEVVIDTTTSNPARTEAAQVGIPTAALEAISEKTEADVTVKTDVAEVTMDNKTAGEIAEQATGATVQIVVEKTKENANKVEFELKVVDSNGKVISDFNGGSVSVTVKVPTVMKDKKVVCVYIDDNGKVSKVKGRTNADGTYTFVTNHFSSYAIMAEEEADGVIAVQTKEEVKAVKDTKLVARTAMSKAKGKKAVKVYWYAKDGSKLDFDGYEVYRSLKKDKGYGTKPFFKTKNTKYYNTSIKKGTKYYYRVRAYKVIDGKKVYTDYSTKAWRTVK